MFEWPEGLPLWILLIGFLANLAFSLRGEREDFRFHWRVTVVVLAAALLAEIFVRPVSPSVHLDHRAFDSNPVLSYLSVAVLLFSVLSHINFYFEPQKYASELSSMEIAMTFCAYALTRANHMFIFVLLLPLALLLISAAPSLLPRQKEGGAIYVGISRGLFMVVLLGISVSLFEASVNTLWLNEIQALVLKPDHQRMFWLGWSLLFVVVGTFFISPLLQFFTADFEKAESWSTWGYFQMFAPLIGTTLILRLFLMLQSESLLNLIHGSFGAQAMPGLGLNLFLLFGVLGVIQSFFYRQILSLSYAWLVQPLLLLLLGVGVATKSTLAWGLLALLIYVGSVPLFSRLMVVMRCPLQAGLAQLSRCVSTSSSIRRIELFLLFTFLSPVSSFIGFELLSQSIANLSKTAGGLDGSVESILTLGVMASGLLFGAASLYFIARVFSGGARQSTEKESVRWPHFSWDYILLIPFIILGIYPAPLYNYVVTALKFLTWIP